MLRHKAGHVSIKEKVKVQKLSYDEAETEDEILHLASGNTLFSQALKVCQDQRSGSLALLKKQDKRRPDSLDLNNMLINAASSPRLSVVKKASVMASHSGVLPSPGTPNYRYASVGVQKGWSSEHVPIFTNAYSRHVNTALMPYNNGKALPSKWEDAERWILSPVMGDSNQRSSFQQQQQQQQQQDKPKSKSGPLGPPGIANYSMYSPAMPMSGGGTVGNIIMNSPFSAQVMEADGMSTTSAYTRVGNRFMPPERCMARSVSLHGYTELISQSSSPMPQVIGKVNDTRDGSRAASRRDMATQMSPEGSPFTSPGRPSSYSTSTPSILPVAELPNFRLSRSDIRDVQVDEGVTVTRWSKKNKLRILRKGSGNDDEWKKNAIELGSSSWENSKSSISISKVQREEARIIAWENLQKAKAEAAIRKLEMKLEKKRSSSMDKIINKLRLAQKKAQEMRSSVIGNQSQQVSKTSDKAISLSGCFTCPAF